MASNPQRDSVPEIDFPSQDPKSPNIPRIEKNNMIEKPKCMKANECARWLGVAKITWVRSNIAGKTPRGLRLGRLVLWNCEELEGWLKAGMPARVVWEANNKRTKKEIVK